MKEKILKLLSYTYPIVIIILAIAYITQCSADERKHEQEIYQSGYDAGYRDGEYDAYEQGYADGYEEGYDNGLLESK